MTMTPEIIDADVQAVTAWMANRPDTKSVASFVPGPGIQKLALSFDGKSVTLIDLENSGHKVRAQDAAE